MNNHNTNSNYDSDDSDGEDYGPGGAATTEAYDPERQARIQQMVAASNEQFDILKDDQVTDFVLRMAEKNKKMVASAQQQQQHYNNNGDYDSEEEDEDEDEERAQGGDELDASFSSRRRRQQQQQQKQEQYRNHSPDEYPPGEAYHGDEGDEGPEGLDELPSFDPKEDDLVSYGRLCCVACALIICMIATSIIILIFVVALDGGGEESAKRHEYEGVVLPIAPSNLQDICTVVNLQTMQGVLDCRDPCMKAACCWEEGENGGEPICWESHPLECQPYESCANLLHAGSAPRPAEWPRPTSSIPVAPEGVNSCDPLTINSVDQVLLCEDACSYGTCCWKKDDVTCYTDPNCAGYKPCEILNTGGEASGSGSTTSSPELSEPVPIHIPTPPDNLISICSQNATHEACSEYCHAATCCWKMAVSTYKGQDGGDVTVSVLGSCSHRSECDAYKPCRGLPGAATHSSTASGTSTTTIPPAANNLNDVCNPTSGNVDTYELCSEECHKAPCCWKRAVTTYTGASGETITEAVQGSCSHRTECGPYEPCKALPDSSSATLEGISTIMPASSIPQPPDDLDSLCQRESLETCQNVCNQAMCCWKASTTTYSGPNGETIIESLQGSCSFEQKCNAYSPCKNLPEASTSESHQVDQATSDLETVCNPPESDASSSLEACEIECHQATCCWKTATTSYRGANNETITESVKGTCSHLPECEAYQPCSMLDDDVFSPHAPAVDPTPAPVTAPTTSAPAPTTSSPATTSSGGSTEYTESMIYDACYNHVSQPGQEKTMCEIVCEAGLCCFDQGSSCDASFDCVKYEPCGKLVQDVDAVNNEPTPVETACANTEDLADCVALCSGVTCCYTTNLEKSCDVTNPGIVCSEYTPCEVLYGGGN